MFCLVHDLGATSEFLMSAALKPSTRKTYTCAQNKFLEFCKQYSLVSLPVTEETLLLYVAFLFEDGFKGTSIRVYLSAIRSLHIYGGFSYPANMTRLQLALKGAVRNTAPPDRKLPITYDVLVKMLFALRGRFDAKLFRAVMTLAFFGCFRASEFCVADGSTFDGKSHLCFDDLFLNQKGNLFQLFLGN